MMLQLNVLNVVSMTYIFHMLSGCRCPHYTNPDLALVVHKIENNTYTARTCLTLKMAYNNARLIVKPQSTWLKP